MSDGLDSTRKLTSSMPSDTLPKNINMLRRFGKILGLRSQVTISGLGVLFFARVWNSTLEFIPRTRALEMSIHPDRHFKHLCTFQQRIDIRIFLTFNRESRKFDLIFIFSQTCSLRLTQIVGNYNDNLFMSLFFPF